jgi:hypothetical protein
VPSPRKQIVPNRPTRDSAPGRCANPSATTFSQLQARSPRIAAPHDWYMSLVCRVPERVLARWLNTVRAYRRPGVDAVT